MYCCFLKKQSSRANAIIFHFLLFLRLWSTFASLHSWLIYKACLSMNYWKTFSKFRLLLGVSLSYVFRLHPSNLMPCLLAWMTKALWKFNRNFTLPEMNKKKSAVCSCLNANILKNMKNILFVESIQMSQKTLKQSCFKRTYAVI